MTSTGSFEMWLGCGSRQSREGELREKQQRRKNEKQRTLISTLRGLDSIHQPSRIL